MTRNGFHLPTTRDLAPIEQEAEAGFKYRNIGEMRRALLQSLIMDYQICRSLSNGRPAPFEIDETDAPILAEQIRRKKSKLGRRSVAPAHAGEEGNGSDSGRKRQNPKELCSS